LTRKIALEELLEYLTISTSSHRSWCTRGGAQKKALPGIK
jgi:hypothetical protein